MNEDWRKYEDIINLAHPEPVTHSRMSPEDRAAQFAPFAALSGYDAMVNERARFTDSRPDLDEDRLFALNATLAEIISNVRAHPSVRVTWFRKDSLKSGGACVDFTGEVRDVDLAAREMIFRDGRKISLDDVCSIVLL